jgi:hypothetical protein
MDISVRRILCSGISYTIYPSFIMPAFSGFTDDVSKALLLRKFNVPFWGIAEVLGRDAMYWYRRENSLGRFSLVGTTINNKDTLPTNISADEKHTRVLGEKAYIATTVANECILGCELVEEVGTKALNKGYGVFKVEAQDIDINYSPKTVNLDGWNATNSSWKNLFPKIAIIACFLHIYIKLRDRSKIKFKEFFHDTADKLWDCYNSESKIEFIQKTRVFAKWANLNTDLLPSFIIDKIKKLRKEYKKFSIAFDFPNAHRTSNMLDRLMQKMNRRLFSMQYFHGDYKSGKLNIRAWALIQNFAPSNPFTIKKHNRLKSPAERLNKMSYSNNWLENLLVSSSLSRKYYPQIDNPPKPL